MQNFDGCKFALLSGIAPCNPSQEQEDLPNCMEDTATIPCLLPPTEFPPTVPSVAPPPLEQASTAIAEQLQPVRRVRRQQTSEVALGIMASRQGCPSEPLVDTTAASPMDPLASVRLARMRTDANIRMARRQQYSRKHMLTQQPPRHGAEVRRTESFNVTSVTAARSLPAAASAAQRPSFEDCDLQLQQAWTFSNTSDAASSSSGNAVPNKMLYQSAPFIPRPSRPPSDSSPVTDLDRLAYSMQLITRGRPLSEVMSDMKSIRQRWNFSN